MFDRLEPPTGRFYPWGSVGVSRRIRRYTPQRVEDPARVFSLRGEWCIHGTV